MNNTRGIIGIIEGELVLRGSISFARFMELALYCPNIGYYERPEGSPGRAGDYYTSVSVGPLFGELLAARFAGWLAAMPGASHQIVESGVHDGRLARDILRRLQTCQPDVLKSVEYWILEPSRRRRQAQEAMLKEFQDRVRWFDSWDALPPSGINGVIFSNELLDAMPVHRLGWDAKARAWFEWGVGLKGRATPDGATPLLTHLVPSPHDEEVGRGVASLITGSLEVSPLPGPLPARALRGEGEDQYSAAVTHRISAGSPFVWTKLPKLEAGVPVPVMPDELLAVLPHGFSTEVCPAAVQWWQRAAQTLRVGKLLAFDYGLNAEEFFTPERKLGTLRGYHQHGLARDILERPGEQDITASVNFSAIRNAGELAGVKTETFSTQSQFLTEIVALLADEPSFQEWFSPYARQFQTLTHPEHLGQSFRVLVQARGQIYSIR